MEGALCLSSLQHDMFLAYEAKESWGNEDRRKAPALLRAHTLYLHEMKLVSLCSLTTNYNHVTNKLFKEQFICLFMY